MIWFSFVSPFSRVMPRRGWSTVEVPQVWFQMLRGQVPHSEQWPKVDRKVQAVLRQQDPRGRSSRSQGVRQRKEPPTTRIPCNPGDVLADARSRVGKLEAAISVLDKNDPTVLALKEALRQARSQTQVRPVEERIESTKLFIERAKKRVTSCREELALQLEAQRDQERIPPTAPADFAQELAELRVCVAELQRERDELRSEFDSRIGEGQEIRQRKTMSLAPIPRPCDGRPSIGCRSIRSDGNDDQSVRCCVEDEQSFQSIGSWWFVKISSRYGMKEIRIGEASHPGPPR